MLALTMLGSLYLSFHDIRINDYWKFGDAYLAKQAEALSKSQSRTYEEGEISIDFNEKGNVNQARTIHFGKRKIIVELGSGRLVYK